LESLDRVRHEETQARQNLRATLTEEHEQRLRASAADFDQRTRAMHAETDRRVAELNNQLASATRTYAEALAPLHDQLTGLRAELAERTTTATGLRRKLDDLRTAVGGALDETTDEEPLRHRISAALERDASP
jgi:DNA anti-recombination protein RmuC